MFLDRLGIKLREELLHLVTFGQSGPPQQLKIISQNYESEEEF